MISFSYLENSEEDQQILYSVKDSILDFRYPNYCINNSSAHNFARVLFCTYSAGLSGLEHVHIHENFLVNLFNTTTAGASKNTTIQVNLEAGVINGRAISGGVNCTCEAYKVNTDGTKDTAHDVIVTEESYKDSTGATVYGIGVWANIEGYSYIALEPLYSMSANSTPIHKDYFNAYYYSNYLSDSTKVADTNLANLQTIIAKNQITVGMYDTDLAKAELDTIKTKLNKTPNAFYQNSVYYSNTYTIANTNVDEVISPYSIRGTSSEKVVTLDAINKSFKVITNGTYAIQLRNGFYAEGGNTQLTMNVFKNDSTINDLKVVAYLNDGEKNTACSSIAIVHLNKSDSITLKLNWSDKVTIGNDTFVSIFPLQLD